MKRKRVAILAADVCGYSRLVAEDEEGTLARLIADRRLFDSVAARWNGRVFNTAGDAVLAEFTGAADALRAGIAIQDAIRLRNAPEAPARRLLYRMGLSVGDVVEQKGDLLGDAVNVAARLEALAEPGGLCLSRDAHGQLAGGSPCRLRDIGPQRLKNMPQPVHAYLAGADDLAAAALPRPAGWRGWWPRPSRLRPRGAAAALGLFAFFAGAATVLPRHDRGPARPAASAEVPAPSADVPRTFVFGPEPEPPAAFKLEGRRPFALDAVPFVDEAARAAIGERMAEAKHGSKEGALALARGGTFGVAAEGDGALRACFDAGGTNCRLYAAGGEVVWPEPPPPLPPRPWVDPSTPRTPFDAGRIAGLKKAELRRIARDYAEAGDHRALVLGPHGIWAYRKGRATAEEAERLALESCGEFTGTPCRVVAVDGDFVVAPRAP